MNERKLTPMTYSALLGVFLLVGTLFAGCSSGKNGETEDELVETTESEETAATASVEGETIQSAAGDEYNPVITHTATLKTALGDIVLELYGVDAPKTVANFVGLSRQNVYDSVLFHRVVPGFVIQGGDPKSKNKAMMSQWGTGGTSIYDGAEFVDELDPNSPSYRRGYKRGVLAMANRGPNTNTSQFFIMVDGTLPPQYTIFGYVHDGMDVVDAIVANGQGAPPPNPVMIQDVEVTEYRAIPSGR